jgi:hypothetical protein
MLLFPNHLLILFLVWLQGVRFTGYLAILLSGIWPASWCSGQSFWLLIMKSRVRFPVLTWGFFLEGEDSHGDHGLGSSVELRFKTPPGTSYLRITIHLIGTTWLRLMGVPTSVVGYTSATAGRGDHQVHKGHVVAFKKKKGMCRRHLDNPFRLYGRL